VREALDRLVASGLAERVPYRGVRVPKLEYQEIVDAFIMRLVLECLAARLAVQSITAEEIQNLAQLVEQSANLLSLEDVSTLRQLNKEFHRRLVDSAGNALLSKLYEMATNSFPDWMLYEYLFRHPELLLISLKREYDEHKAIVNSLSGNDSNSASQQVVNHINNLRSELVSYLDIPLEAFLKLESLVEPMLSPHKI
jgi:DNA-binding GntR family transcriptional regulator